MGDHKRHDPASPRFNPTAPHNGVRALAQPGPQRVNVPIVSRGNLAGSGTAQEAFERLSAGAATCLATGSEPLLGILFSRHTPGQVGILLIPQAWDIPSIFLAHQIRQLGPEAPFYVLKFTSKSLEAFAAGLCIMIAVAEPCTPTADTPHASQDAPGREQAQDGPEVAGLMGAEQGGGNGAAAGTETAALGQAVLTRYVAVAVEHQDEPAPAIWLARLIPGAAGERPTLGPWERQPGPEPVVWRMLERKAVEPERPLILIGS